MYRCNVCGTRMNLINPELGLIVECECGIELEVSNNLLLSRQLGPSEE